MGCLLWGRTESDMTEATEPQQRKREQSGIYSRGFFPLEASLPALDGGVADFAPKLSFPGRT